MQLRRTVVLKIVVTEKYREEAIRDLEEAIQQVEQGRSQLDFRSRIALADLQRADLSQAAEFRRRIEAEKQRLDELKQQLQGQLEEIKSVELGGEVTRGTLEGFVDVKPGDNLQAVLGEAELVVKDDVIVEIREPGAGA
ncbi:MAG: YlqD family protein [Armatimonadota bacterium]|nr:YlqD family protein [Armatimonadota bacterium]